MPEITGAGAATVRARYWPMIFRRAAEAAAQDLRLGAVPLAVSILGQAVLGFALFMAVGMTSANIPTRIGSALVPFLLFPMFFLYRMTTAPAELDLERQAAIAALEAEKEERYWQALGGDNARRHALLSQLRELYKLDNDGLSPELMSNLAWPPMEWLNAKLERRGLLWRIERIEQEKVFTTELN